MKKIVFEGTEEQIQLMKDEFEMLIIEHSENKLPALREDYQTENLWCVEDVTSKYKCEPDEALDILHSSLTNEETMNQIWFSIDEFANMEDLEGKPENQA